MRLGPRLPGGQNEGENLISPAPMDRGLAAKHNGALARKAHETTGHPRRPPTLGGRHTVDPGGTHPFLFNVSSPPFAKGELGKMAGGPGAGFRTDGSYGSSGKGVNGARYGVLRHSLF